MTVGAGAVAYGMGAPPCSGIGLRWSGDDFDAAIDGRVVSVLFDDEGKANIEEILAGLAETDFAQDGLRRVLEDPDQIEDWRVGEAIAEAYLTDHRSCSFPWPDGRDERKTGSCLPDADLVGFGIDDDGDCLVSSPSSAWYKLALSQPDRAQRHRELRPLPGGPHRAIDPPQEREHLCHGFARRHTSAVP